MRNLIIGIIIGMLFAGSFLAWASDDISIEKLWNRVFSSTTNSIRIEGV